jgi:hypothetical protein
MTRLPARLATVPVVAGIVLVGLWFFAGVVTNDFVTSGILTAVWFGVAGAAAVFVARRRRALAVPVLAAYLLTAGGVGVYLAWSTLRDRVVNEQIASAGPGSGNRLLASGAFTSGEHETSGEARVIRLRLGGRALTLDLRTSAGPDLRVYLALGYGIDVGDHVDLGSLKGNIGTQQYAIPADTNLGRYTAVVIYCRAFSAPFGRAVLNPTA